MKKLRGLSVDGGSMAIMMPYGTSRPNLHALLLALEERDNELRKLRQSMEDNQRDADLVYRNLNTMEALAKTSSNGDAVQACWVIRSIVAQRLLERAAEQRRIYSDKVYKAIIQVENDQEFWSRLNYFIEQTGANPDDYYTDTETALKLRGN